MLVRCGECSQVVEVASLSEHLVMECERREHYIQCSQCTEAIRINNYEEHATDCIGNHTIINHLNKKYETNHFYRIN